MLEPSIETSLLELFSRRLHVAVPSIETDLIESGLLDSAAFVDLLLALEEEFGIEVSVGDLDRFHSVHSIAELVLQRAPKAVISDVQSPPVMKGMRVTS